MGLAVDLPEQAFWDRFRYELTERPEYAARMSRLPEVAGFRRMALPKAPIKLRKILAIYKEHADVKPDTKREWANTFEDFLRTTGADTLDDLTGEPLKQHREAIKDRVSSPATVGAYFSRVRGIIAFAKTEGLDAEVIDAALSRMEIL